MLNDSNVVFSAVKYSSFALFDKSIAEIALSEKFNSVISTLLSIFNSVTILLRQYNISSNVFFDKSKAVN